MNSVKGRKNNERHRKMEAAVEQTEPQTEQRTVQQTNVGTVGQVVEKAME